MFTLPGRITSRRPTRFRGYRVQAEYEETIAPDPLLPREDAPRENAPTDEGLGEGVLRRPALSTAEVAADGRFTLSLPYRERLGGEVTIAVLAPDGTALLRRPYATRDLPQELALEVAVQPAFVVRPSPDPLLGRRVRVAGRVLVADDTVAGPAAGRPVVLWARPEGAPEDAFQPVLTAETTADGYFSGEYPRGRFAAAYGVVGGWRDRVPVPLEENGTFPRRVVLVVRQATEEVPVPPADLPSGDGEVPCRCRSEAPRAPDPEDLVNAPGAFSSDAGGGRCVDFTAPNRTLEEFSFYTLLRTTDPQIRGLTLAEPRAVPGVVTRWLGHALALQEGRRPALMSRAADSAAALPYPAAANVSAAAPAVERLLPAALAAKPELLKQLTQDPDGFTPAALMTAERRAAVHLVREMLDAVVKAVPGRGALTADNPVDWDDDPTFYQATTIAHGHILHFKQIWRADGYSLGDLLYSLPLAPCQKKQIAIVDWDRREAAARTEQLEEEERLQALLSRDRDISEIVRSTLTESMAGGSEASTWAAGGGFGLAIGPLVLGAGGGGGGASSSAWQESARRLAADSLQQLRDRTLQSASAVRSQRATVVQTVRQGESVRVQTEVVANHNHCHAVTIEYFEVLRHFQVSQELVDVQECLFIPLLISRFDAAKALRWREPLRRALRDRRLVGGFDALERIRLNYEGSDLPTGRYAEETLEDLDGELRLRLTIARPRDKDDDFDPDAWAFWGLLLGGNPEDVYRRYLRGQQVKDRVFQEQLAPRIAEAFVQSLQIILVDAANAEHPVDLDPTLVSRYQEGASLYVSLRARGPVPALRRDQVRKVVIRAAVNLPPYSKVIVESAGLRYRTAHMNRFLLRNLRVMDDLLVGDAVHLPTPLDRTELRNPRDEDREISRRLLAHLNEHIEYYHKAIWWSMDPDRRFMLLDGFVAPNAGGRSVASVVENRLIGIVGNCLVMPVARGFQLDPTYRQNPDRPLDLLHLYAPLTPVPPMRVSVPTRGVFAEAVMGSCNACEVKDETRFWRFEESPCGDEPTPIADVSAASRRAEPGDLKPSEFPAPIINLQNAPPAPDPSGLGAALQLLGTANLFRDVTGLEGNQRNALAAFQEAMGTARFFGGEAAKLALQRSMSRDIDKTLQAIQRAERSGLISREQAGQLAAGALRGLIGDSPQAERRLTEEPEVRQLLSTAAQPGGGDVTITRPGETVEVRRAEGFGLASLFGAGSGAPRPARPGSTVAAALQLVSAFRSGTGASPWRLSRTEVADRLAQIIQDPNLVNQGQLNLCGPAAFFRLWLARDPVAAAQYAIELYERGRSAIGSFEVAPDDDLVKQDYNALRGRMNPVCPPADWMMLGALRDASNWFWDFEGTPDETVAAATTPAEVAEWLAATALYSRVRDEGNWGMTRSLDHAKGLNPGPRRDVAMLINAHLLSQAALVSGVKKSDEIIGRMFPNHFIVLTSAVVEVPGDKVAFSYWTWGDPVSRVEVAKNVFQANYYGAVIAEV